MNENNKNNHSSEERNTYTHSDLKGFHRAVPILLTAAAFIIFAGYFTENTGFGAAVSFIFKGLFGFGAWAIPVCILLHALFYAEDLFKGRMKSRIVFSAITVLIVSVLDYGISFWSEAKTAPFTPGQFFMAQNSGGFIGSTLAWGLMRLFGPIGLIIIAAAIVALYVTFFYAGTNNVLGRVFFTVMEYLARFLAVIERWVIDLIGRIKEAIQEKKQREIDDRHAELVDDDFFQVDNGMKSMSIKEIGFSSERGDEEFAESPTLHSKVHMKSVIKEEPNPKSEVKAEATPAPAFAERTAPRAKTMDLNYSFDHLKKDKPEPEITEDEPKVEEVRKPDRAALGLDDVAENIFTKDFDPFDFNAAEKIATRMSSKAPITETIAAISKSPYDVDDLTEEGVRRYREKQEFERRNKEFELKKQQRLEEFERRKAELHQMNAAQAQTAPAPEVRGGAYTPRFTAYSDVAAKEDIFTVKENKIMERQAAEIANREAAAEANRVEVTAPAYQSESSAENNVASYINSAENAPKAPAYSENAAPAEEISTPAAEPRAFQQTVASPEPKFNTEYSKTVAFNVYSEVTHKPAEDTVHLTTQKYGDTSGASAAILSAVASKNPMYAMSENVINGSFSYTVKADPEELMPKQPEAPATEENAPFEAEDRVSIPFEEKDSISVSREMIEPNPVTFARGEAAPAYTSTPTYTNNTPTYTSNAPATPAESRPTYAPAESRPTYTPAESRPSYAPERSAETADISATFSLVGEDEQPEAELELPDEMSWTPEAEISPEPNEDEDDGIEFASVDLDGENDEDDDDSYGDNGGYNGDNGGYNGDDDDDNGDYDDDGGAYSPEEIPPEEQNPDVLRQRGEFSFLREEDEKAAASATVANSATASAYASAPTHAPVNNLAPTPAISYAPAVERPAPAQISIPEVRPMPPAPIEEKKEKPKLDFSNYKFPSVDFLISPPEDDMDYTEETQEKANTLIEALESFSVTASIKGVDRGPRITRYEVVPARGVKVSSVLNLQDDIALYLAANAIRMEAPIPGKSAIGIEVPNKTSTTVYLRELIETPDFQNSESKTTICVGKDVAGAPVFSDIAKMPHLLVAGATGMGKSVCMNSFMISMLYKAKPDEVKFIMIDPKQVEFMKYNGIPHLLVPVVDNAKQAAGSLMWAVEEMNRRYGLIKNLMVTNIGEYNDKVKRDPSLGEFLPRIVIVIDEFADLMLEVKDPVEKLVLKLAQKARAAGIHLVIGTQRPDVSVITGTIKANIPSRISCKVASNTDSRTILECVGAEQLLDKGDMLFSFAGAIKPIRVQGAFVSSSELEEILNFIKDQFDGNAYDDEVLNEINRAASKCGKKSGSSDDDEGEADRGNGSGKGPLDDPQFLDAVDVALGQGQISTALLQRRLSIGFGKAARFIDYMEDMGLVSEKNGAKPRNVLLTREEWLAKVDRVSI